MAEARQHGGVPAKLRTDASRRRAVGQPSQGSVWLPGRAYEKADGILGGAFCGTAYCELGKSPLGQQKASAIPSEHGRLLDTQQMQQFKTDEPPRLLAPMDQGLICAFVSGRGASREGWAMGARRPWAPWPLSECLFSSCLGPQALRQLWAEVPCSTRLTRCGMQLVFLPGDCSTGGSGGWHHHPPGSWICRGLKQLVEHALRACYSWVGRQAIKQAASNGASKQASKNISNQVSQ